MKILFVHQNFPGQFKHLAPALAAQGHEVVAFGINRPQALLPGVRHLLYTVQLPAPMPAEIWSPLRELQGKIARGHSVAKALCKLADQGWRPDVIFAHPGWGEALFLRDVFPAARLLVYAEYFYGTPGGDTNFDPEFANDSLESRERTRIKNSHLLHALSAADAALSPTAFQRSQHPVWSQAMIRVVHDGIDTAHFKPDPQARVTLKSAGVTLQPGDEVITFVARQLEPYRGYHIFMRALPLLQKLRPQLRTVIVGGDEVSYGAAPPQGQTWRQIFFDEVSAGLDLSRIHFVGRLPHAGLTQLMQVSAAHVYLTYPFVLSWSLLEAMSIGCLIVGARTAPLQEVIEHGRNGLLTDFFDTEALAHTVADALARRDSLGALRATARADVVERFDLRSRCLPDQIDFVLGR